LTDDSFHGESLAGFWKDGIPIGPFNSCEKGTGGVIELSDGGRGSSFYHDFLIPHFHFSYLRILYFTLIGNIFSAVVIGYCSMRTEDWSCLPEKDVNRGILTYGLVSVECCISGDFYRVYFFFLMFF
jgi:hypothetical protein